MAHLQMHPLRVLSEPEKRELQRLVKATSERLDVVRRARALLSVAGGRTFTDAAHQAGLKSGDGVGKLVMRFNAHGLAALSVATGRGRKMAYTSQERSLILQEVQRPPDREEDGTATWSLKMLERALRKKGLMHLGASTIREVLHESGYSWQQSRTWVRTGYALRVRKSGTVTTYDPETDGAKKTDRASLRAGGSSGDCTVERR
jgi:transposase